MRLVFVDTETTGLDPNDHTVIQIAAIAVDDSFRELATFERKVLFRMERATEEALEINSYDPEVWEKEAIHPEDAAKEFSRFLRPFCDVELVSKRTGNPYHVAQLAGHNAQFDMDFLEAFYKRLDNKFFPAAPKPLDTMGYAMWRCFEQGNAEGHLGDVYAMRPSQYAVPDGFSLGVLCEHFGIEIDAHDALSDVRATVELAKRLLSQGLEIAA